MNLHDIMPHYFTAPFLATARHAEVAGGDESEDLAWGIGRDLRLVQIT